MWLSRHCVVSQAAAVEDKGTKSLICDANDFRAFGHRELHCQLSCWYVSLLFCVCTMSWLFFCQAHRSRDDNIGLSVGSPLLIWLPWHKQRSVFPRGWIRMTFSMLNHETDIFDFGWNFSVAVGEIAMKCGTYIQVSFDIQSLLNFHLLPITIYDMNSHDPQRYFLSC